MMTEVSRFKNVVQFASTGDRKEPVEAAPEQKESPSAEVVADGRGQTTGTIIRPLFKRWLFWKDSGRAKNSEDKSGINGVDSDVTQVAINDCLRKLKLLNNSHTQIQSELLQWTEKTALLKSRVDRAASLLQSAKHRLGMAQEKLPNTGCDNPGALQNSYMNFEMQLTLLQQKQVNAAQQCDALKQQKMQSLKQISTETARIEQLESQLVGNDNNFKQAA